MSNAHRLYLRLHLLTTEGHDNTTPGLHASRRRGDELARSPLLTAVNLTGSSACAFVVGGPFGHGDAVIKRADRKIKLSSMVMNHQVARLVLLEQIYRAWTILRGEPYHH